MSFKEILKNWMIAFSVNREEKTDSFVIKGTLF
jgi:hypothetical protein